MISTGGDPAERRNCEKREPRSHIKRHCRINDGEDQYSQPDEGTESHFPTQQLSDHRQQNEQRRTQDRWAQVGQKGVQQTHRGRQHQPAGTRHKQQMEDTHDKHVQNSHVQTGDGQQVHGATDGVLSFHFTAHPAAVTQQQSFGRGATGWRQVLLQQLYGAAAKPVEYSAG